MPAKRLDWRRVKINRSYTLDEVARLLDVHTGTVRNWSKAGLAVLDSRRPHLVLGLELKTFLDDRRKRSKSKCGVGQLYCLRCRAPRNPAGDMLDYLPINLVSGNLCGICCDCEALMFRRCALSKIDAVKGRCIVEFPQGQQRIADKPDPSPKSHLAAKAIHHGKTQ